MIRTMVICGALAAATPAFAQDAAPPAPTSASDGKSDFYIVGAGAAYFPDYEGSDDYRLSPGAAGMAHFSGISVTALGPFVTSDLVPRGDSKLDFDLGPAIGVRLGRGVKVHDPVVALLPERKTAVEVGLVGGVTYHGLTNPYDMLSVHLNVTKDLAHAHRSTIVSPSVDFSTPVSRTTFIGVSASVNWVGDRFADYYYSIDAADSAISGLPAYKARGGLKNWRLSLAGEQVLKGDLTHGLGLFGAVSYSRLTGDIKRSPIVAERGSANQWLAVAGLGYTF